MTGPAAAGVPETPGGPDRPGPLAASALPRVAASGPARPRAGGTGPALPVRLWKRHLPPVRLVWIFLLVLVGNAHGFASVSVAEPLLLLPGVAAASDLGLQAARFPRLRVPDAAVANGLFLAVILWPASFSLELASVAGATVALRHLLRRAGHPWLNPAALGVSVAATVFALPQPWHVGASLTDTVLVAALGLVLWSRARHGWRLWTVYFAANVAVVAAIALELGGHAAVPLAVEAAVLGPAPVFYGLFMVTEPRTAPSSRNAMLVFGALVGTSAALFPAVFALVPTVAPLGVLAPYLALFVGNVYAGLGRSGRPSRAPAPKLRATGA